MSTEMKKMYMATSKHPYPTMPPSSYRISPQSGTTHKLLQKAVRSTLYPEGAPMTIMQLSHAEARLLAEVLCMDVYMKDVATAIQTLPQHLRDPTPSHLRGISRKLECNEGLLPRGSALCATHAPLNAQIIRSMVELVEGEAEDHLPALLGRIHPKKSREVPGEHSYMFDMTDSLLTTLKTAENFMVTALVPQEFSKIYRRAPDEKWSAYEPCDACLLSKLALGTDTMQAIMNIASLWSRYHPYKANGVTTSTPIFVWMEECFAISQGCKTEAERRELLRKSYTPAAELAQLIVNAEVAGRTKTTVRFAADGVVEKEIQRRRVVAATEAAKKAAAEKKMQAATATRCATSLPDPRRVPPPASSVYSPRTTIVPHPSFQLQSRRAGPPPASSVYSSRANALPLPPLATRRTKPPPASSVYSPRPYVPAPAQTKDVPESYASSSYSARPITGVSTWYDRELSIIMAYTVAEENPPLRNINASKPRLHVNTDLSRQFRGLSLVEELEPPPRDVMASKPRIPTAFAPWTNSGGFEPSPYELEQAERVRRRARER